MTADIFVFDTNHVSNLLRDKYKVLLKRIRDNTDNTLVLCTPVIYEVERGLLHKGASRQLERFREDIIPLFSVVTLQRVDWQVAAALWALTRRNGKQLADADLLIAALALRLQATVVTNDRDFAYVPNVSVTNWIE